MQDEENVKLDEATVEFADNPENRCPCVLLLDTSESMGQPDEDPPIQSLSKGLRVFKNTLSEDALASKRVEVAVVTYNSSVQVVQDFVAAQDFDPPDLHAGGLTAMGAGILEALRLIDERKRSYKQNGIAYYRPWILLLTDGLPTDDVTEAAQRVKAAENGNHLVFFAVGVEGADMDQLSEIAVREPVKLRGLHFNEMFRWLSSSMQRVSSSRPGEQVPLPPPGWAEI